MSDSERIWARRLRWRFRGAWQWPAFVIATVVDGMIIYLLPPVGPDFDPIFGIFVATFGNLFLIGAIAPWLARRLHARARGVGPDGHRQQTALGEIPLEVVGDRTATALLAVAAAGLVIVGLGNREVVVSETKATETNQRLVRDHVARHGSAEVKRNIETANTHRLESDYFRTCINLDDRTKAYCVFVDTRGETVVRDPDMRPNGEAFPE